MQKHIKIHPADKVAVALCPLPAGTVVSIDQREITLTEDIPQGHKFALCDLDQGEPVIKYGLSHWSGEGTDQNRILGPCA